MLTVNEIFRSIQGESTRSGLPCVFIRLQGCDLSCSYCDTAYAKNTRGGHAMSIRTVLNKVFEFSGSMIEVTGGEPLLQEDTLDLLNALTNKSNMPVLLETNGSIKLTPNRHYTVIMDLKCPSSGASDSFCRDNAEMLTEHDEVKCVIRNREDFDWTVDKVKEFGLFERGIAVLLAPVYGECDLNRLAGWILESELPFRLQPQLHKIAGLI